MQVVIKLAEAEGTALEDALAAPALATSLRELPAHLPVTSMGEEDRSLQLAILHCVRCDVWSQHVCKAGACVVDSGVAVSGKSGENGCGMWVMDLCRFGFVVFCCVLIVLLCVLFDVVFVLLLFVVF